MGEEYKIIAKLETEEAEKQLDAFMEKIKEAISLVDELTSKLQNLCPGIECKLRLDGKKFSQTLKEGDTCDSRIR